MKTLKLKRKVALLSIATTLTICFGCDDKTPTEEAREAATFMCDCVGGSKSQSKLNDCLDEMKKKFNDWGTDEFIKTFNKENDCNLTLSRTTFKTNENSSNSSSLHILSVNQTED